MTRTFPILLLLLGLLSCKSPQNSSSATFREDGAAQRYYLVADDSELQWTGKASGTDFSLIGGITAEWGSMAATKTHISKASLRIDMNSISHEMKDLVKHLKNEDFFDVKNHPKATFELGSAIPIQAGKTVAKGKMNIRGITQDIEFPIQIGLKGDIITCQMEMEIDRTKFGSSYNSPNGEKDPGEHGIADLFTLTGKLVFKRAL